MLAVVVLALVACGDDGDAGSAGATSSTPTSGETADESEWCDDLAALRGSGELTDDVIAEAPADLRAPLEDLAGSGADEPDDASAETLAHLLGAQATVDAWGYDHCDADHPFCFLWIQVAGLIAGGAFAEDGQQDEASAELRSFIDEIEATLVQHAPPELRASLDVVVGTFGEPLDGADERAAEAAYDELDTFTESGACPVTASA